MIIIWVYIFTYFCVSRNEKNRIAGAAAHTSESVEVSRSALIPEVLRLVRLPPLREANARARKYEPRKSRAMILSCESKEPTNIRIAVRKIMYEYLRDTFIMRVSIIDDWHNCWRKSYKWDALFRKSDLAIVVHQTEYFVL